ncbi:MAG: GNAT family N-acetyltransferase [Balneolaceae bacterium]
MIDWRLSDFYELSPGLLYDLLKLRQDVFIVEQKSIYPDLDGLDEVCGHLTGLDGEQLAAYLRIVPPGEKYKEPSLGRIIVAGGYRGNKIGYELVRKGLDFAEKSYGKVPIRIEAQAHLEKFYSRLGFRVMTEPFDSDGIPHIEMLRE